VTVSLHDADGETITPNATGWFNQAVTVRFSCTDPLSGGVASGVVACPDPIDLGEGVHDLDPPTVVDVAGNVDDYDIPQVNIDLTAPTLVVHVSHAANEHGWNNQVVTVTFDCGDAGGSGRASGTCPATETYGDGQFADEATTPSRTRPGTCRPPRSAWRLPPRSASRR
jgi:hypothetical protein